VCFQRGREGPGAAGDPGWAAAALIADGRLAATAVVAGRAGAPYEPGLLALREGPLLEEAVRGLPDSPEVLLVNATGRDHPRRAGLALHLGERVDLPTVGVTSRPLIAEGAWPPDLPGAASPLKISGEVVGYWVRTQQGVHPLAAHAAWRTDPQTAVAVVLTSMGGAKTPEPLRQARRVAREARSKDPMNRRE
jgi:deoxyribonuclease V